MYTCRLSLSCRPPLWLIKSFPLQHRHFLNFIKSRLMTVVLLPGYQSPIQEVYILKCTLSSRHFRVSRLTLRLILLEVICVQREKNQVSFSTHRYPVLSTPFIKDAAFSLIYVFFSLCQKQVTVVVLTYIWVLGLFSFGSCVCFCVSIMMFLLLCFCNRT